MILISYFTLFIIKRIIFLRHELYTLWLYVKPFLTWRIIVCYLPFWFLATGWAWVFSVIGKGWFRAFAISWLGIMWLPCCPEKIITIPLAIWLHIKIFPNHSVPKILQQKLTEEKGKFRQTIDKIKNFFKIKKNKDKGGKNV
jgi:hypothetical protein